MKHSQKMLLAIALVLTSTVFTATTCFASSDKKTPAVKPYPLEVCIVTDNDLGSMGDEQRIVYKGQEIKFCCSPCERKFLKAPEKYLRKIAPPAKDKDASQKLHLPGVF